MIKYNSASELLHSDNFVLALTDGLKTTPFASKSQTIEVVFETGTFKPQICVAVSLGWMCNTMLEDFLVLIRLKFVQNYD